MGFEADDRDMRREQDFERLGTRDPRCSECPESDPAALTGRFRTSGATSTTGYATTSRPSRGSTRRARRTRP